jgi:ribosomal small subunit protein bTHX
MGKGDIKTRKGKIFNHSYGVKRPRKKKQDKKKTTPVECVYCGKPTIGRTRALKLEKKNGKYPDLGITKDHVPQQCLYDGYAPSYKTNRYTVPACRKCNEEFSVVEGDLRDLIGIANENDNLQEKITESAVRNILSKKEGKERLVQDKRGNVVGVEFDFNKLKPSHIKNFKGVYYKTYGKRFPDSFEVDVIDIKLGSNFEELAKDFLDKNSKWNFSGHKDIFSYRIELVKSDSSGILTKADNLNEAILIICHLVYHKKYDIIVLGSRKKLKTRKIN